MKRITLMSSFFLFGLVFSQEQSFVLDFESFCQTFIETHPVVCSEGFDISNFEKLRLKSIENIKKCYSKNEFVFEISRFTASIINDSHTGFFQEEAFYPQTIYPFSCRWIQNKLYITKVYNNTEEDILWKEIVKINDSNINDFLDLCLKYIPSESILQVKNQRFNSFITNPDFLKLEKITDSDTLTIFFSDNSYCSIFPKRINYHERPEFEKKVPVDYQIENTTCFFYFRKMWDESCNNDLEEMGRKFGSFYELFFDSIINANVNLLVVDLRENDGGFSLIGGQLLYCLKHDNHNNNNNKDFNPSVIFRNSCLFRENREEELELYAKLIPNMEDGKCYETSDFQINNNKEEETSFFDIENPNSPFFIKPKYKNIFKGNVIFLMGNKTYSSAADLILELKRNKQFTIIGEESCQKPNCFGDIIGYKLPSTSIQCNISCKKFNLAEKGHENDDVIYPNIIVRETIEDIRAERDVCKEWILNHYNK